MSPEIVVASITNERRDQLAGEGHSSQGMELPLGTSDIGSTQEIIDHEGDQDIACPTPCNYGAMSPWRNYYSLGIQPVIENNPHDLLHCFIFSDAIEPSKPFYSSDLCGHVLCETHVWQNMTHSSFPETFSSGQNLDDGNNGSMWL